MNSSDFDFFEQMRANLSRMAYRMIGSMTDAEDVVQDAYLKWMNKQSTSIKNRRAYIYRVVANLCLDHLKQARVTREKYVGQWLPEPVVDDGDRFHDDITLPLMMALERLTPLERAAFILHDVFGVSFLEVASVIGRSEATCRKIATRARVHVQEARPRFPVSKKQAEAIASAFYKASRTGDFDQLSSLFHEHVVVYADGGGKVDTTLNPISGREKALRLFRGLGTYFDQHPSILLGQSFLNGLAGFVTVEGGDVLQTTTLNVDAGKISAVYVVRNPDKLKHIKEAINLA